MSNIEQLPAGVVNKIAAGEVIERPASVVKELVENAIDARATRIDVTIEGGGSSLIRVVDNGSGIAASETALAVTSHATSKIRSDQDLFRVQTLGFRGEALASIASVSRLRLRSRTASADGGAEMEVVGGEIGESVPCGCPQGTAIEVHDLFFNTPVRRKFLRSTQTEMGHATEAFTRLALAFPAIHFTLTHNQRQIHDLPPVDSWRLRIAAFFGHELAENLISVENQDDDVRLAGFVANPSFSRGNNRMQYLLLNGRYIRDRSLQHALSEAYRGLLLTGRFPISFLRLDMPPELVDVNVHPTKLEVRFQDGGRLYSQLLGTLRTRFLTTDLTAKLQAVESAGGVQGAPAGNPSPPGQAASQGMLALGAGRGTKFEGAPPAGSETRSPGANLFQATASHRNPAQPQTGSSSRLPSDFGDLPGDGLRSSPESPVTFENVRVDSAAAIETARSQAEDPEAIGSQQAMQVHNRYLVAEIDNGLVVIDQHALHERVIYEQIRDKVLGGAMETQNLLVPEPVDLAADEAAAVLDAQDLLEQLGVRVEPFGGDTLLISSYPAMLANWSPKELLRTLAEQLTSGGKPPERRDLLDGLLHMISCKAAIKAGDRLTPEEVTALLEQRDLAQDAHHCPHGRPTALVFTCDDLDKQFKRV